MTTDNQKYESYKDLFRTLQIHVFDGDTIAINKWFKKYKNLENDLTHYIFNEPYFFMFRSFQTVGIQEESFKRHKVVLNNLSLENQLNVLMSEALNRDISIQHIKLLKYNSKDPKHQQIALNDRGLFDLSTKIFNQHKFDELEQIEKFLNLNLLENQHKSFAIHYKEKNSKGCFYIDVKDKIFTPKDDIIFNFTVEKQEYLNSRGVILKNKSESEIIINNVLEYIKNSQYLCNGKYQKHAQGYEKYFKAILYAHLDKQIEPKETKIKPMKI